VLLKEGPCPSLHFLGQRFKKWLGTQPFFKEALLRKKRKKIKKMPAPYGRAFFLAPAYAYAYGMSIF
jgi:hypothetical protein